MEENKRASLLFTLRFHMNQRISFHLIFLYTFILCIYACVHFHIQSDGQCDSIQYRKGNSTLKCEFHNSQARINPSTCHDRFEMINIKLSNLVDFVQLLVNNHKAMMDLIGLFQSSASTKYVSLDIYLENILSKSARMTVKIKKQLIDQLFGNYIPLHLHWSLILHTHDRNQLNLTIFTDVIDYMRELHIFLFLKQANVPDLCEIITPDSFQSHSADHKLLDKQWCANYITFINEGM